MSTAKRPGDIWNQYLDEGKLQYPFCEYPFNIILNLPSLGGELNGRMTWPGEICDEDLLGGDVG